jgi:hypothetical protein
MLMRMAKLFSFFYHWVIGRIKGLNNVAGLAKPLPPQHQLQASGHLCYFSCKAVQPLKDA